MNQDSKTPIPKISRLPDTDLARYHDLTDAELRWALVPHCYPNKNRRTYGPVRARQHDIFQASTALLRMPTSKWPVIEAEIRRRSRGPEQETMNVLAAHALFDGLAAREAESLAQPEIRRSIGLSSSFAYGGWLPFLVTFSEVSDPVVPIVDFRVSNRLTGNAFKFVFSMMDIAIRGENPEYEQAAFAAIQLIPNTYAEAKSRMRLRTAKFVMDDQNYYTLDELEDMIRRIYSTFEDVLQEQHRKAA